MTTTTEQATATKLVVRLPGTSWQWLLGPVKEILAHTRKTRKSRLLDTMLTTARLEVEPWGQAGARLSVTATDQYIIHQSRASVSGDGLRALAYDGPAAEPWYLPEEALEILAPSKATERRKVMRTLVLSDDGDQRLWRVYNALLDPDPGADRKGPDQVYHGVLLGEGPSNTDKRQWPAVTKLLNQRPKNPLGTTAVGLSLTTTEVLLKIAKTLGATGWWYAGLGSTDSTGAPARVVWSNRDGCMVDDERSAYAPVLQDLSWLETSTVVATLRAVSRSANVSEAAFRRMYDELQLASSPWEKRKEARTWEDKSSF